jgi:hypothetical protein
MSPDSGTSVPSFACASTRKAPRTTIPATRSRSSAIAPTGAASMRFQLAP